MPERRLLVHTPDVQEAYMDGRFRLGQKARLAQETELEAERGPRVQGEAHHEGRRDGDHRTL